MRPLAWAGVLLLGVMAAFAVSIWLGSVALTPSEVVTALTGGGDPNVQRIVVELRAPRAALAILVGGGLALAGAVFQALLRNPLAEPYILGISGGAATGAVLALSLGLVASHSWALPAASFTGALLAIVLVMRVAAAADDRVDVRVLLLAGVVVGAFFSACISFVLSVSDARTVRSAVLWMMGSLAGADWPTVATVTLYTVPAAVLLAGLARPLNLMAIGEETAGYLGTNVERVKKTAYVVASLLTAAGVAATGVIGFVGAHRAPRRTAGRRVRLPHAASALVPCRSRVSYPGRRGGPGRSCHPPRYPSASSRRSWECLYSSFCSAAAWGAEAARVTDESNALEAVDLTVRLSWDGPSRPERRVNGSPAGILSMRSLVPTDRESRRCSEPYSEWSPP